MSIFEFYFGEQCIVAAKIKLDNKFTLLIGFYYDLNLIMIFLTKNVFGALPRKTTL
jgi:hypothetical protein